ncbi:unnamed protein product [Rotaria socialis]|uniref:Uncharacterized protein n=1 Tax=Rotaria socialis TaxID=392032 RepID=A0A818EJ97_9BILA|nr:unnamed protein product [Rotaria socialis]CAF4681236.1 unnamed protein product [Rotaria socialis]
MRFIFFFALCLLLCYIHLASSDTNKPSTTTKPKSKSTKEKDITSTKTTDGKNIKTKTKAESKESKKNTVDDTKTKGKIKTSTKSTSDRTTIKDKTKVQKDDASGKSSKAKGKKTSNIRTPFDQALEKLSICASSSPSLVDVMQENLQELQSDEKYIPLFNAAPHTTAFLKKKAHDSSKFIGGLRQALNADWSNPTWKSWDEINTLFRPFKQQFVYAMMRFNCT